ncbi:hypothetical protein [Candidatus Enterococcus clewellii]|uniref:Uncharacterized protein n=1 Tax=Candidatus Enterococcus clewellii TaxID=1834193 RepID=A0A242KB00_9ENTE|nr:hypothetical protein [Enterococcus sp. 9E7_DIV0242]OTP18237.1 hypothetical protein A5888_000049 [Enterococcus sp. 9E7_DIV0242]
MNDIQLAELALLLKELFQIVTSYGAPTSTIKQVENILAILYEEDNSKKNSEVYHCLKGLYFPKAGLSEFYVSPAQSVDWQIINQRLSALQAELSSYEHFLERYR